jgi:hypothetical protein
VLWSLLRDLASEIRDGRVAMWAIDPKGGMELGRGEALARFASHGSGRHAVAGRPGNAATARLSAVP